MIIQCKLMFAIITMVNMRHDLLPNVYFQLDVFEIPSGCNLLNSSTLNKYINGSVFICFISIETKLQNLLLYDDRYFVPGENNQLKYTSCAMKFWWNKFSITFKHLLARQNSGQIGTMQNYIILNLTECVCAFTVSMIISRCSCYFCRRRHNWFQWWKRQYNRRVPC